MRQDRFSASSFLTQPRSALLLWSWVRFPYKHWRFSFGGPRNNHIITQAKREPPSFTPNQVRKWLIVLNIERTNPVISDFSKKTVLWLGLWWVASFRKRERPSALHDGSSGPHPASPSLVIYFLSQSVKYTLPASDSQIFIFNIDLSLVQIRISIAYLAPSHRHLIAIWNTKGPNRTQLCPCHPSPWGNLLLTPILPIKTNTTMLQTIAQALKLEVNP